jgi:hypothetical protein
MTYVGSKQKCPLDRKLLVTIYCYCSMFNPPIFGFVMLVTFSKPPPSSFLVASFILPVTTAAASPPMSPPLGTQKLSPPPARRSPRVAVPVVPVIQGCTWQCHLCTYKQEFVPGSRTCIMCHSTRRRLHRAPQRVRKSKLVVQTRGVTYDCPNCRLAKRCKVCLLACREKCINDIWGVDANDPLK